MALLCICPVQETALVGSFWACPLNIRAWQAWGDTDADGKPIRWSTRMRKPDSHATKLLVGSYVEPDEYTTCSKDDYLDIKPRTEPKLGLRETKALAEMMEKARNHPAPPPEKTIYVTEAHEKFGRKAAGTIPLEQIGDELGSKPAITVYTSNGKNTISADGQFGKNTDFSTPAELYTKDVCK